ncbi:MAG: hypothetical protein LBU87_06300 [Lactobacillales bacterium]|jgi:TPR repeat protein|nr:hypothetical protein [Lactobacillales bacterium]
MKKTALCTAFFAMMTYASVSFSQNAFWAFDEFEQESLIPSQCDGQFDEARGGVFMPTPDELYEQGELFLLDKSTVRANAGYCFISAALQGHTGAQLRLAQLYNKGIVLPQNDLIAYKWAFIAALNGNKEAERLALTLESFLSTDDIELATGSIQAMLPTMTEVKNAELVVQNDELNHKKEQLNEINKEIDAMLGIPTIKLTPTKAASPSKSGTAKKLNRTAAGSTPGQSKSYFTEADRKK